MTPGNGGGTDGVSTSVFIIVVSVLVGLLLAVVFLIVIVLLAKRRRRKKRRERDFRDRAPAAKRSRRYETEDAARRMDRLDSSSHFQSARNPFDAKNNRHQVSRN
jgi:NADH:ubiquinone oxidoreductase subunit 3 (subunit A)